MQIIWVSGPVGHIRTITVSYKHLVMILIGGMLTLFVCGALMQLVGFRIAIELNPSFLKKMGNFHSATEIENLKYFYESKLQGIQKQVEINHQLVADMQAQNKKLIGLAIPPALQKDKSTPNAQGGPLLPPSFKPQNSILGSLDHSYDNLKQINQQIKERKQSIDKSIDWMESKPLSMPMNGQPNLTSGFGRRLDPISRTWSEHEGLDFTSALGEKIYAAGRGTIKLAAWDGSYGLTVLIDHGDGYISRYAHASRVLVKEGDKVERHQPIALVGSSGRSTGPHLHFEIIKNGTPVNPVDYLIALRPSVN